MQGSAAASRFPRLTGVTDGSSGETTAVPRRVTLNGVPASSGEGGLTRAPAAPALTGVHCDAESRGRFAARTVTTPGRVVVRDSA
jgi:hypothetical protein